jgi:glycosyltransferase involved in cell wall biosynthesis
MSLIAIVPVWNEAEMLPDCIRSTQAAGIEKIHVFDGAWLGGDGSFRFGKTAHSTDGTLRIAEQLGAEVHSVREYWPSQEAKRTYMFGHAGATEKDHLFVLDADDRVLGQLDEKLKPGQHYNCMERCIGPNDMPGIRGVWPNGDYSATYIPCLHVFAYHPTLECLYPGCYLYRGEKIEQYGGDGPEGSALPILQSIKKDHHGNERSPERLAQKRDYYRAEHPYRKLWQEALHKAFTE